jgi:hypothetical protein
MNGPEVADLRDVELQLLSAEPAADAELNADEGDCIGDDDADELLRLIGVAEDRLESSGDDVMAAV